MTSTSARLDVSPATYREIRARLVTAGYLHAVRPARPGQPETLDMQGVGLCQQTSRSPQASPALRAQLDRLARAIEREWQLGGLNGTVYFDFAVELVLRLDAERQGARDG